VHQVEVALDALPEGMSEKKEKDGRLERGCRVKEKVGCQRKGGRPKRGCRVKEKPRGCKAFSRKSKGPTGHRLLSAPLSPSLT
jgi:hypothetical protein